MKKKKSLRGASVLLTVLLSAALLAACGPADEPSEDQNSSTAQTPVSSADSSTADQSSDAVSVESQVSEPDTSQPDAEQTPESGDSSSDTTSDTPQTSPSGDAGGIVSTAKSALGTPFLHGGSSPETGFDNSGFLYYVARKNGVDFPRKIADQAQIGSSVSYEELKSGDIAFFSGETEGVVSIGGIIVDDNTMILCTKPGEDVREKKLSSYWKEHFVKGVRLS